MHAHKVVVGSLIQSASHAGIRPERALPELSGVLADFIEQLIQLGDFPSRRLNSNRNLVQRLEKEILSGSIRIENSSTGYPVFSYQPTGWKEDVPLMNTSSMVSELAPVVLYLRHVVSPGEVLIIEEPESHLHPGMQVAFIRHLAAAVRSGIRIIITTHSEWVLEELANLVRLSKLSESDRKGIGGADYALSPDQVGTWLFEPKKRPKGSIVKEIPLDVDYGGFRSDYDDIAIGTHNDWATISNRIEEKLNQMTMMESVRGKLDAQCLRKQCRAGKCSISLKGVSRQFVLIHMDSPSSPPSQHETRCDYLFIGDLDNMGGNPWTVPIELNLGDQVGSVPVGLQSNFRLVLMSLIRSFHITQIRSLLRLLHRAGFRKLSKDDSETSPIESDFAGDR